MSVWFAAITALCPTEVKSIESGALFCSGAFERRERPTTNPPVNAGLAFAHMNANVATVDTG